MKNLKLKICILLVFISANLFSQEVIASSGGNAIGSGGSSSYTIGQIFYTSQSGSNGSVSQGVQQAFEIYPLSGQVFKEILLVAIIYPNPVINNLILSIKNFDLENLNYQLFDIQGKIISNQSITSDQTTINLENNPTGIYVLKVNSNSKEIKSFKIIKN